MFIRFVVVFFLEIAVVYVFKSQVCTKTYFFHESCAFYFFNALIFRALIPSKELLPYPFYSWRPETWKHSCSTSLVLNHTGEPQGQVVQPDSCPHALLSLPEKLKEKKKNLHEVAASK